MAFGQGQVVLPGQAVATGIEARVETAILIGIGLVLAAPCLEGHQPGIERSEAGTAADQVLLAVGVGIETRVAEDLVIVVVRLGPDQGAVEFQAIVEAIAAAQVAGQVAVAVSVWLIARSTGALGVDPRRIEAAHPEAVPAVAGAAADPGAALQGLMGAVTGGEERLGALAVAAPGEDLDHPADGLRAVQAGTRPADHLDALDQLHRQVLERGEASAGRADLDAVDQHQHMVGLGAAQEQRGVLAETAVVRQRHAGYLAQQLRHAARLAALDILAVDDAHRRQALGSGLGGTGGGHHLVGKADRFGQAQGRRAAQRHGCRGQENSVHALRCSVALTRATWVEADGGRSDGRRRPTAPSAMPWVRQAGLRARERSAGRFQPRLPMPEHSGHRAAV